MDDTHSLLDDWYVMSLCFPYINANFKHRSGRNIPRDMSFSRGNARTLGVHRHADLEDTRLEKDKPNEKTERVRTRITSFFALFPCVKYYVNGRFLPNIHLLSFLFIYFIKSAREEDEIAGYNEATGGDCNPRCTSIQHAVEEKATSGSRNLLRGRRSVLLQRITRLATSLVPSLMPRASYRGSRGNQTCVERKHTVSCRTLWRDTLK